MLFYPDLIHLLIQFLPTLFFLVSFLAPTPTSVFLCVWWSKVCFLPPNQISFWTLKPTNIQYVTLSNILEKFHFHTIHFVWTTFMWTLNIDIPILYQQVPTMHTAALCYLACHLVLTAHLLVPFCNDKEKAICCHGNGKLLSLSWWYILW